MGAYRNKTRYYLFLGLFMFVSLIFITLWVWSHGTYVTASTEGVNFYPAGPLDVVDSWGHNWTVMHNHTVTVYYWFTHTIPGVGSQCSDLMTVTLEGVGVYEGVNGGMTSFWDPLSPGNYTIEALTSVNADDVSDSGEAVISVTKN